MPAVLMVPVAEGVMLQVPPVVPSVSAVVAPTHKLAMPPIAAGAAVTVSVVVTVQPVPSE